MIDLFAGVGGFHLAFANALKANGGGGFNTMSICK